MGWAVEPDNDGGLNVVQREALGDRVADILRESIVLGKIRPGENLREPDLATSMGVSRGPVREALAQLAREGLVIQRRHHSAQAAQWSISDIEEIYTLRLALEELASQRAAELITEAQIEEIDDVLLQMNRLQRDYSPREAAELDLRFHDIIYESAAHSRLLQTWHQLRGQVFAFLYSRNFVQRDFFEAACQEHRMIRDMLAAGDKHGLKRMIKVHLEGAYEALLKAEPDKTPNLTR